MDTHIKYVAELSHVREVSLLGAADLGYWEERLKPEGLSPVEREGRAQILVSGAEGRFMGLRFRELSFSVLVGGYGEDAAYLVRAFNSRRFFALCERVFYSTPYYGGDIGLGTADEPFVQLTLGGVIAFRAQAKAIGPKPREGLQTLEQDWQGPVFLPGNRHVFFAKLSGRTQTYPFLAEVDTTAINAVADIGGVLQALVDSGFTGREWVVRADAAHAKSKTYLRSEAPLPAPRIAAEISLNSR
jgi:hypothetical protein